MTTFQFPAGTTQISKQELAEAFINYERVEIPGTVYVIDIQFDHDIKSLGFNIKELVLNEGIQRLRLLSDKPFKVNVPKSLLEIQTNVCLPQVLCLPQSFGKLNWGLGLNGVEYLQAYSDSDVRYCFHKSKLKHYVYLGNKISAKSCIFEGIPDGCVIHVESNKMAEKVLKKGGFDISKVYVIADAAEWKDFPAEKLALSMEEYNPSYRITPAQTHLLEEMVEEQERKAVQVAQEERVLSKGKIMGGMLHPFVEKFLSDKDLVYKVSKTVTEGELSIQFTLSKDLYILSGIKSESPEESLRNIVDAVQKVKDLYTRYKDDIASLSICISESCGWDRDHPYMSIPLKKDLYVRGNMRMKSLATDASTITLFANELELILDDSASNQIKLTFSNQERLWL